MKATYSAPRNPSLPTNLPAQIPLDSSFIANHTRPWSSIQPTKYCFLYSHQSRSYQIVTQLQPRTCLKWSECSLCRCLSATRCQRSTAPSEFAPMSEILVTVLEVLHQCRIYYPLSKVIKQIVKEITWNVTQQFYFKHPCHSLDWQIQIQMAQISYCMAAHATRKYWHCMMSWHEGRYVWHS